MHRHFWHLEVVKYFFGLGVDINAKNDGWSCTHYATYSGKLNVVNFLVENGVDVNAQTNEGKLMLWIMKVKLHLQLLIFLFIKMKNNSE